MTNYDVTAIVKKAGLGLIDINSFKYNIVEIEVANFKSFKAFIPVYVIVNEGDFIKSKSWAITRFDFSDPNPTVLAIRFDEVEITESYEPIQFLLAKVSGMWIPSSKPGLRTVGPTKKAFIMSTLKLRDEFSESYTVLFTAFNDCAKQLSTVKRLSTIRAEVCIKPKKYIDGYEFCANTFEIIKEGGK